jgi:hypothetical protein
VTIILSVVTAEYAVQVSDRLLTQEVPNRAGTPIRYDPWDPTANKSVVVLGRDGLFTMGYSGPAHISAPRRTEGPESTGDFSFVSSQPRRLFPL